MCILVLTKEKLHYRLINMNNSFSLNKLHRLATPCIKGVYGLRDVNRWPIILRYMNLIKEIDIVLQFIYHSSGVLDLCTYLETIKGRILH